MKMDPIVASEALAPKPFGASGRYDWRVMALLMLVAAFALRSALFGNQLFGEDEQFYLLVGDRMLHGAIPYVDIWDRKPYGLFLLFAGIRAIGGPAFLVAEVIATLFAGTTAFIIATIAARRAAFWPSAAAGGFYLLMLGTLGGDITQTSVFYNLFVAVAAWLVLRTGSALDRRGDLLRAMGAMLLCGLAIQVKTNAVFEGAAIGLWLLWRMRGRIAVPKIAARALAFAAIGLAPTVAVLGGFWFAGHLAAWIFANFASQLLKTGGYGADSIARLPAMLLQAAPAIIAAAIGWRRMRAGPERGLLAIWFAFALVDAFAIGNFWLHYALPLLVPAAILAAHAFAIPRTGRLLFAALALWPAIDSVVLDRIFDAESRHNVAATLAAIPADARSRCVFGYNVPAAYYLLSDACLVTPYIFVDHLRSAAEAHALPEGATVALREALAKRPGTILSVDHSEWKLPNRANDAILAATLRRDYRPTARIPLRKWPVDTETLVVWRRNDLGPR